MGIQTACTRSPKYACIAGYSYGSVGITSVASSLLAIYTQHIYMSSSWDISVIHSPFTLKTHCELQVRSYLKPNRTQGKRQTVNPDSKAVVNYLPVEGGRTLLIFGGGRASFVWPFPSFSPTFCFRTLLQLTHLFLFCSTPIADLYSLSYLWTSGLSFGAAVIFTVIGSFALGDYIQLASFNASFPTFRDELFIGA